MMKDSMRKRIYIFMTGSLCCTAGISTTLQINYTSIKNKKKYLLNECMNEIQGLLTGRYLNKMWHISIMAYYTTNGRNELYLYV